ncbi:MAG: cobyrinic acid a,c-diamide synthase [Gammaproteobacteria bacterium]|nr:MAG: cobyrinic acid a,c-diamide synthase [Gammaproteobacteria bacterium]
MNNQASSLQQLTSPAPMRVIAVSSGKGGVGKTNVSVNLAVSLARKGQNVVLFDADLGLANVDIALGLKPKYDIHHVIKGERTLEEILLPGPAGIQIIPASSGVSSMTRLSQQEQVGVIQAFSELSFPVDTLIVDTSAGIEPSVLAFSSACQDVIVVICDEPTSITDAYALIKVLNKECGVRDFQVIANMVDSNSQGVQLYDKITRVTDRFLEVNLGYLGAIPRDDYLRRAVQQQNAVVIAYPRSKSAQALSKLADTVEQRLHSQSCHGGLGFFVERLVQQQALSNTA